MGSKDGRIPRGLGELNGLEIWQTDVGNAYLEATTEEKVYVIAARMFIPIPPEQVRATESQKVPF